MTMTMIGLDSYIGTKKSFIGVDFLNLASGAFKTAGGALASGTVPGAPQDAQAADKARQLEEAKRAAEQSASTWKLIGVVGLIAAGIGGVFWYRHRA